MFGSAERIRGKAPPFTAKGGAHRINSGTARRIQKLSHPPAPTTQGSREGFATRRNLKSTWAIFACTRLGMTSPVSSLSPYH